MNLVHTSVYWQQRQCIALQWLGGRYSFTSKRAVMAIVSAFSDNLSAENSYCLRKPPFWMYDTRVFQKCTFSKKKTSATQYVPLQGKYKPDPKYFFPSSTPGRGYHHSVKNGEFLHCRFSLSLHMARLRVGWVKILHFWLLVVGDVFLRGCMPDIAPGSVSRNAVFPNAGSVLDNMISEDHVIQYHPCCQWIPRNTSLKCNEYIDKSILHW